MNWRWSLLVALCVCSGVRAQDGRLADPPAGDAAPHWGGLCGADANACCDDGGLLKSDRGFPGFIGWISNPTRNFDPRSLTQIWPIFGSQWVEAFPPLPSGDLQVYGPGLSIALNDRLCVGVSNGGYMVSHFAKTREGWANLSGFVQYTAIRDVEDQFLVTGGLIWEAPTGSKAVFQGDGPAYLAPYLTAGKEFDKFHVLFTTGYNFALGESTTTTTDTYYANVHLDRCVFGWLYPLVEFNSNWTTKHFDANLRERIGFINFDRFDNAGSMVTVAPGVNAVLIRDRLEMGGIYETPIWSAHGLHFNTLLLKMVLRF
jgi:hypothetical protein